jgi:hypothetical protein
MPRISAFYGIVISMFWNDHPEPHFHARYAEHEAVVAIRSAAVVEGFLPPRALRLVREWASAHRVALAENWERARRRETLRPIEPLR